MLEVIRDSRCGIECPTGLLYKVMRKLAIRFKVAILACWCGVFTLRQCVLQGSLKIPVLLTQRLIDRSMLGGHVIFKLVMIDAVVAGRASLGLTRLNNREGMPGMAGIA